MAAIGKLTIKRTDLIKKVKSNREEALAHHEKRYGKELTQEDYKKSCLKYAKDLAKFYQDKAKAAASLSATKIEHDLEEYGYVIFDEKKLKKPVEPKSPQGRYAFDSSGFDEVIELLELSTDEFVTLTSLQYARFLKGWLRG